MRFDPARNIPDRVKAEQARHRAMVAALEWPERRRSLWMREKTTQPATQKGRTNHRGSGSALQLSRQPPRCLRHRHVLRLLVDCPGQKFGAAPQLHELPVTERRDGLGRSGKG